MVTGVKTHENGFVCCRSRVVKWVVTQRLNMFNPQRERKDSFTDQREWKTV